MSFATQTTNLQQAYDLAKERYAALGVDTDQALAQLGQVALSLHCWQGDDVQGFERTGDEIGGGLAVTGNYLGRARTPNELRRDLDQVYGLIPGSHRLALHGMYAETGGMRIGRDELLPGHFAAWVDWARANRHGLDMNPSLFAHPMASSGFTLASYDPAVRRFWVRHCIACRKIGEYFGRQLGTPCVTNIWIPDGFKDTPADRLTPRKLLLESLDTILAEKLDPQLHLDAVEPKLFGIGSESYVVGSMEFYTGYAITRNILLTLDTGHFHPTEQVADKLSAVLLFADQVLLHVSRGVRWDSDHVVTFSDDLQALAQAIVRAGFLDRVHIGLDYFDASINRIAAWSIGARNTLRAMLQALLEPYPQMRELEVAGDFTARLALQEELKNLPLGAVWDYYCWQKGAPVGMDLLARIQDYEKAELAKRG